LYALIEPFWRAGEPVILDFRGVKHWFDGVLQRLGQYLDRGRQGESLPELLRYENLAHRWGPALELASDFAIRWPAVFQRRCGVWDEFVRQYSRGLMPPTYTVRARSSIFA